MITTLKLQVKKGKTTVGIKTKNGQGKVMMTNEETEAQILENVTAVIK
jgi:hypothetical protein